MTTDRGRRASDGTVWQLIEQNDQKHEEGHKRLRGSVRELEDRVDQCDKLQVALEHRVTALETKPADVLKLSFSTPVVAFIVANVLTMAAGMWAVTYSLRSDVSVILAKQAAQETMQAERSAATQKAIDNTDRRLELYRIQIQELRDAVLDLKRSKP